ncbi:hypothetical protein HK405_012834 [Cladochytrium tenue]|nr:hypothetical protein HK405_012834 [Cladochytrium tenue]
MAYQGDYKMEYPAAVYVPQVPDPVALQSARRGRRAAVLLAFSAVIAFFTPFVPDHFWTYRQESGGYQFTEYIANVYTIVCIPSNLHGDCQRFAAACYEYSAKFGSDSYCGLLYSQLAFAVVVLVAGLVASAMAGRHATVGHQSPRKNALFAAVAFLVLLVVLIVLTASTLGRFIKDIDDEQFPVELNLSIPTPFVGFLLPLVSLVLAACAVHALRL